MAGDDEDTGSLPAIPMLPVLMVGVVLIGALLGAVIVLAWVTVSDSDEPATATSRTSITRPDEPRKAEPSAALPQAAPTRLERCASAASALEPPLEAARPALDQWELHVEAMNELVAGAITLQQATDFWDRTRVGAQRRVERFRESVAALRREGVDCPVPGLLAPGARTLRPCSQHVHAEIAVLRAARTSIDTWAKHVHHMEMLRSGTLSPERATEMWVSMWQQGVRDLDDYRRATRDVRLSARCPAA